MRQCNSECHLCSTVDDLYPGKWVAIQCDSSVATHFIQLNFEVGGVGNARKEASSHLCGLSLLGSR